eukprot:TRINITY_DN3835_c0_g1_i1.p2 TRINITY_DN3835_c0_g1~~TRINITY_DN3835_c0_g1_i1.p2  ORF type:complete len:314 (+),score=16.93 TRINITY_DN3835_c0_g1_i1:249-1190(+)
MYTAKPTRAISRRHRVAPISAMHRHPHVGIGSRPLTFRAPAPSDTPPPPATADAAPARAVHQPREAAPPPPPRPPPLPAVGPPPSQRGTTLGSIHQRGPRCIVATCRTTRARVSSGGALQTPQTYRRSTPWRSAMCAPTPHAVHRLRCGHMGQIHTRSGSQNTWCRDTGTERRPKWAAVPAGHSAEGGSRRGTSMSTAAVPPHAGGGGQVVEAADDGRAVGHGRLAGAGVGAGGKRRSTVAPPADVAPLRGTRRWWAGQAEAAVPPEPAPEPGESGLVDVGDVDQLAGRSRGAAAATWSAPTRGGALGRDVLG